MDEKDLSFQMRLVCTIPNCLMINGESRCLPNQTDFWPLIDECEVDCHPFNVGTRWHGLAYKSRFNPYIMLTKAKMV